MTRVGGVVGRDTVSDALAQGLQVVVPLGSHICTLHLGDEDVAHIVLDNKLLLFVGESRRRYAATHLKVETVVVSLLCRVGTAGVAWYRLVCAVEHKSRNLVERELRGQILGTLNRRESPILILVELSVAV